MKKLLSILVLLFSFNPLMGTDIIDEAKDKQPTVIRRLEVTVYKEDYDWLKAMNMMSYFELTDEIWYEYRPVYITPLDIFIFEDFISFVEKGKKLMHRTTLSIPEKKNLIDEFKDLHKKIVEYFKK
ncbi:hypothetical protein [Candidatus Nucleicultrix amoebiphila]|jgi:hypothetical protein|uniref:DUF4296 domain-containing protein n=1 Tax=Candidatus Nucleicultrix amoebiphila FS5 TaxID=1414854 RepID=A0A1W6N3G0_9PROT|nr:hypothetical protein [Candidatus Nucleicultrix amoebiphila]ARN84291.1 hypothetical protein GQ61_01890 [Candidatus Nucleicultrix amoebiphila FS5]